TLSAALAEDGSVQPPGVKTASGLAPFSIDLAYATASGESINVWQTDLAPTGEPSSYGKDPAAPDFGSPVVVDGVEWRLVTLSDGTGHQLGRRMPDGITISVDGQ